MKLNRFDNKSFQRGASLPVQICWLAVEVMLFSSWLPGSFWRRELLKLFGAKIEKNVLIKPRVRIKFPWRLKIGNDSWIGEGVWIDNLANVEIGENVCISQGVYICTGNHDYQKETFDLLTKPVIIEDGSWICAFAKIAPGVRVRKKSVVGFGAVLISDTKENIIYFGNPAVGKGQRNPFV